MKLKNVFEYFACGCKGVKFCKTVPIVNNIVNHINSKKKKNR